VCRSAPAALPVRAGGPASPRRRPGCLSRDAGVRYNCCGDSRSAEDGIEVTHRFPALIAAPAPAPAQALAAATGTAAETLGLDEHTGTVTEGKLADLIIVDGDSLAGPGLRCDPGPIWLVLQQGVPVAGQALVNQGP